MAPSFLTSTNCKLEAVNFKKRTMGGGRETDRWIKWHIVKKNPQNQKNPYFKNVEHGGAHI